MRASLALLLALALLPCAHAKDTEGRPEAIALATTYGFYQGIALSILLAEHDALPGDELATGAALTLLTTTGTLAGALYITDRYGVNDAQASMVNSSFFWSMLNVATMGVGLDQDVEDMVWTSLVSGWSGQAIGILLAANVDRTAGQVSLANSVGLWTGAETTLALAIFDAEEGSTYALAGTAMADLGLLAGSYLSAHLHPSRERARWLDLGALAGGLAGPAALFMVYGPEENVETWYLSAVAVGIPVGIATAWHLTRHLDDDDSSAAPSEQALMVPLAGGFF